MIEELTSIILDVDIPEYNLLKGDIGTVVMVHEAGKGYEVEFCTLDGETLAITTLYATQVRSIASGEIAHVRKVA